MNVDELVFSSLAPSHVKTVIKQIAPFPIPKIPWWRAAFTAGLVVTMVTVAFTTILVPQRRILVDAKDALCAGDRNFVYSIGALGSPAWSYPG